MDTTKTITHLGLCAGYGGIELGLKRVLPVMRTVALCEIEAFAIANLVAKMEAGLMDPAPIWTDLKTFPWDSFRDRVDILTGGYPCQPFSTAGKRAGANDPRHLWPFIADGIQVVRPKLCFFENVEGHISLGLQEVIADLESLGYKTAWGIFSAAECGAPHQRKRVFIMAHRNDQRLEGYDGLLAGCGESGWVAQGPQGQAYGSNCCGDDQLANAGCQQSQRRDNTPERQQSGTGRISRSEFTPCHDQVWPSRPGQPQHPWEPPRVVGNADCGRQSFGFNSGSCETTHCRGEGDTQQADGGAVVGNTQSREDNGRKLGNMGCTTSEGGCGNDAADCAGEGVGYPEGGDGQRGTQGEAGHAAQSDQGMGESAIDDWRHLQERSGTLRPKFTSWRQTQPALGRDIDGTAGGLDYAQLCVTCDNRTDELRLLGNGVVPATAQKAFLTLINEIQKTATTTSQLG